MPQAAPTQVSPLALITALEAAGEITRIRLLALLCEAELTVSELVTILGQSQPRISRHLKLLGRQLGFPFCVGLFDLFTHNDSLG
jgi:DNA-binding transcriptional ArsR family regulator